MWKVTLASVLVAGLSILASEQIKAQERCSQCDCLCYSAAECSTEGCGCAMMGRPPRCNYWSPDAKYIARAQKKLGVKSDPFGELGKETKDKILQFQKLKGLKGTGELDFKTYKALGLSELK